MSDLDRKNSQGKYSYHQYHSAGNCFLILISSAPIPYDAITTDHYLFDLIYNPEKTLFLKKGEEKGATVKNGYEMLVIQAEESWKIWNS